MKPSVLIPVSSDFRTSSPSDRIQTVTGATVHSGKNKIAIGTDNGTNRIAAGNEIANSSIAIGTDSGKSTVADNSKNKKNEISITNDEYQATLSKRHFNSNHEKENELSEDYNGEYECREQNGDAPCISPSDVEAQLQKLIISAPEGELCEPSSVGSEACHSSSYSSSEVRSSIVFVVVHSRIFAAANVLTYVDVIFL
jgi:hypothetical protein